MISVECYADEYLIKSLGFPSGKIKHEGGKGNVVKAVKKSDKAIGIIDEDPESANPGEMSYYVAEDSSDNIKLMQRQDKRANTIVEISDFLESWLLKRAQHNGISLDKYNLPDDPKKMHDILHIERNINFQDFIEELIKVDTEIHTLKKWIKQAIE